MILFLIFIIKRNIIKFIPGKKIKKNLQQWVLSKGQNPQAESIKGPTFHLKKYCC